MSTNTRRPLAALTASVAIGAGLVSGITTSPASATPGQTPQGPEAAAAESVTYLAADLWDLPLESKDNGDEIIEYRPGTSMDFVHYNFNHTVDDASFFSEILGDINVTYKPFAGDFDADGYDEVVWYAPGTGTDIMWKSNPNAIDSITPITLAPINGTYLTAVGNFDGDPGDEVFWYNANSNPNDEQYWDFDSDSATPLTPIGSPSPFGHTANDLRPYGGRFSSDTADDLVWYRISTGGVYLWDFAPTAAHTPNRPGSQTTLGSVNANITEAVTLDKSLDGRTDIMWYTAGTTVDPYWEYHANGQRTITNQANNQTYDLTAGNFFQNPNPNSNNDNDNSGDDVFLHGGSSYFHNYFVQDNGITERHVYNAGGVSAALTEAISQAQQANAASGRPNAPILITIDPDKTTIQTNGRSTEVNN